MEQPLAPLCAWEKAATLPTYAACPADPDPMFLEKSVYQGSSGKIYPSAVTDRISKTRSDQTYKAIHLENDHVRLVIPPEIGDRIHIGQDKIKGYGFFYRQGVVKPVLVGLLGPWISGGVEFNWPQHHRPSAFMLVHAAIKQKSVRQRRNTDQNPATVRDSLTYKKVAVRCIYAAQYSGLLFICSPKHFVSG